MTDRSSWSESQEIAVYHPGQKVEIKHRPGVVDTVIAYDPMMVPPIVLASDPQPRYPEELTLVDRPAKMLDWLNPWARNTIGSSLVMDRQ
jgi:hypothetical protein